MKVEKLKDGKYKLSSNDLEVITYDEVIVKNNILYKELDYELIKEIETENEYFDYYFKMIKFISKRLRSESEIKKQLQNSKYINQIVEKLKDENLINDRRFAEAFILDKINFTKTGKNKIKKELLDHEIDEDTINEAFTNIDDEVFINQLEKLVKKRVETNQKKSKSSLKEKIMYELLSLGYEKEDILNFFDIYYKDNNDIYKKEYDKIRAKLSKKYAEKELEYKIKEKMYQKGFRATD